MPDIPWKPMDDAAPRDGRRVLLLFPTLFSSPYAATGKWNDDRFAKKPRPRWEPDSSHCNVADVLKNQPTHYCLLNTTMPRLTFEGIRDMAAAKLLVGDEYNDASYLESCTYSISFPSTAGPRGGVGGCTVTSFTVYCFRLPGQTEGIRFCCGSWAAWDGTNCQAWGR